MICAEILGVGKIITQMGINNKMTLTEKVYVSWCIYNAESLLGPVEDFKNNWLKLQGCTPVVATCW